MKEGGKFGEPVVAFIVTKELERCGSGLLRNDAPKEDSPEAHRTPWRADFSGHVRVSSGFYRWFNGLEAKSWR